MKRSDLRSFGRRSTHVHAIVEVDNRKCFPCTIENFSERGAFLVASACDALPSRFVLKVAAIEIGCEVMRRKGSAVGVRFIRRDLATSTDPVWSIDDIMSGKVARAYYYAGECEEILELCRTLPVQGQKTPTNAQKHWDRFGDEDTAGRDKRRYLRKKVCLAGELTLRKPAWST